MIFQPYRIPFYNYTQLTLREIGRCFQNMVVNVEKKFELVSYMADIEKGIIEKTLNKNENNVSKISRELSISRQDLQYEIKKYKITLR